MPFSSLPPEDHPLAELRARLLQASLPNIVFDGWSEIALNHGATSIGVSEAAAAAAFPNGGIEALSLFLARADLATQFSIQLLPLASMKIRQKVAAGVMARLEWSQPHREAIRRGLAMLANPLHAPLAARSVWQTVDTIWFAIGDTSTDMNYYSKRALLSAVYASTLLVWMDDTSEDLHITRAFLDRRIENVMQIEKAKALWKKSPFAHLGNVLSKKTARA